MKATVIALALATLGFSLTASAQQMNYQGRLTDNSGNPNTNLQEVLLFSVWDAPTGGSKVWGDFQKTVDLIDGRFSVKLGTTTGDDGNGNLLSESFGGSRYLQLQVSGAASPLPRQEVLASPKALAAENAVELLGVNHKLKVTNEASLGNMATVDFQPDGANNGILLETTEGDASGGGFFLNGDTAVIYNSDDADILRLYNSDTFIFGGSWAKPVFSVTGSGHVESSAARFQNRVTVGGPPSFPSATLFDALANSGEVDIEGQLKIDTTYTFELLPLHVKVRNGSSVGGDGRNDVELLRLEAVSNSGVTDFWSIAMDIQDQGDEDLMFFQNGFTNGNNGTVSHLKGWIDGGTGGGFVDPSDRRFKKHIAPLEGALAKAKQLKPSTYHWLESTDEELKSIGFIAQEVGEVVPELVDESSGKLGLHYQGFGVIAIGAIQELDAENTDLKARLAAMEKQMASLSQAVATLQQGSTTPVAQN